MEASSILIEEAGEVEGELRASSIAIKGVFIGQIFGGTVKLHPSARVTGEIFYENLSIESGAEVESECKSRPYIKDAKPG